jgi:hypothetical protein
MQPKQKLRLLSLAYLIPFLGGFAYLGITRRRIDTVPAWVFVLGGIYLASTWFAGMRYMLRHREELRDPPEQRERQKQWALKNRLVVLNGLLFLFVAVDLISIVWLRSGRLDPLRATSTQIELVVSVPAILFLLWVRHRLRVKKLLPPGS